MSHRFLTSMSPAAMLVAILAVVLAGAGIGYSAATIGTSDLQNNAVTSPKVKNGTLKNADLVKEEKTRFVGGTGVPYSDGGQGDCQWVGYDQVLPVIEGPGYRIDRSGVVHLSGTVIGGDGGGGDGVCGDDGEDGILFVLPPKYVPARTQFRVVDGSLLMYVIGKGGVDSLPEGAVYVNDTVGFLDGISFPAATSGVSGPPLPKGATTSLAELLRKGRQLQR